jgi:hypothetical protein
MKEALNDQLRLSELRRRRENEQKGRRFFRRGRRLTKR